MRVWFQEKKEGGGRKELVVAGGEALAFGAGGLVGKNVTVRLEPKWLLGRPLDRFAAAFRLCRCVITGRVPGSLVAGGGQQRSIFLGLARRCMRMLGTSARFVCFGASWRGHGENWGTTVLKSSMMI